MTDFHSPSTNLSPSLSAPSLDIGAEQCSETSLTDALLGNSDVDTSSLSLTERISNIPYTRQQKTHFRAQDEQPGYRRQDSLPSNNIYYLFASDLVRRIASTKHLPTFTEVDGTEGFVMDSSDPLTLDRRQRELLGDFVKEAFSFAPYEQTPAQKLHSILEVPRYMGMPKEVQFFLEAAFASKVVFDSLLTSTYSTEKERGLCWQDYASFIARVRAICKRSDYRKDLYDRNVRLPLKRFNTIKRLVEDLFRKHSRLLVVRVDLKYKPEHAEGKGFEAHNADIKSLLKERSKERLLKNCVGYSLRMEQTPQAGLHSHAVFFFDGDYSRNDLGLAKGICERWEHGVTGGQGLAWNVNAHWLGGIENGNKQQSDYALGMVDRRDPDRIERLLQALAYLCHAGQDVITKDRPRAHTFWVRSGGR